MFGGHSLASAPLLGIRPISASWQKFALELPALDGGGIMQKVCSGAGHTFDEPPGRKSPSSAAAVRSDGCRPGRPALGEVGGRRGQGMGIPAIPFMGLLAIPLMGLLAVMRGFSYRSGSIGYRTHLRWVRPRVRPGARPDVMPGVRPAVMPGVTCFCHFGQVVALTLSLPLVGRRWWNNGKSLLWSCQPSTAVE